MERLDPAAVLRGRWEGMADPANDETWAVLAPFGPIWRRRPARRFGAEVVGVGFATMELSVAAPPRTTDDALRVAAEHTALCPDNVFQGVGSLTGYAASLVGADSWFLWWD
ncbi:DUF4253 domain-containing protein [Kitasatospora cinereorecta]|uniref:DUF4253 domain-containing protein n=1 Tax=Kitasatospora cinereorecta TaxID=285560 RepID=UPI0033866339